MIGLSCYILADTFFVSAGAGPLGLAALNIALPSFNIVFGFAMLFAIGSATKYALLKAEGRNDDANNNFTLTCIAAGTIAIIFLIIGLTLNRPLTKLLGADEQTIDMASQYLQLMLCFAPFFIFNAIFVAYIRNDDNPNLAMIAMTAGNVFNIIFDYVFIFPCGLGIFGAGLATAISPIVSMICMAFHFIKKRNSFKLVKPKNNLKIFGNTIALGIPSMLAEYSTAIVVLIFNNLMFDLKGNIGVAAYAIIVAVFYVTNCINNGVAIGVQPLISTKIGEKKTQEVNKLFFMSLITILIISTILYISMFFGSKGVADIFNGEHDENLSNLASDGIRLYFISLFFSGINLLFVSYFSAIGKAFPSQIVAILKGYIVIIPLLFAFAYKTGVTGLWIATPVSEAIVMIIGYILYFFHKFKDKKNLAN